MVVVLVVLTYIPSSECSVKGMLKQRLEGSSFADAGRYAPGKRPEPVRQPEAFTLLPIRRKRTATLAEVTMIPWFMLPVGAGIHPDPTG